MMEGFIKALYKYILLRCARLDKCQFYSLIFITIHKDGRQQFTPVVQSYRPR